MKELPSQQHIKTMNRLRGEKVVVEFPKVEKDNNPFEQNKSGLFIAKEESKEIESTAYLIKGTVKLVGSRIHPQDIKVGDTVYAKKSQGEKLSPDKEEWIFHEAAIIGND